MFDRCIVDREKGRITLGLNCGENRRISSIDFGEDATLIFTNPISVVKGDFLAININVKEIKVPNKKKVI